MALAALLITLILALAAGAKASAGNTKGLKAAAPTEVSTKKAEDKFVSDLRVVLVVVVGGAFALFLMAVAVNGILAHVSPSAEGKAAALGRIGKAFSALAFLFAAKLVVQVLLAASGYRVPLVEWFV